MLQYIWFCTYYIKIINTFSTVSLRNNCREFVFIKIFHHYFLASALIKNKPRVCSYVFVIVAIVKQFMLFGYYNCILNALHFPNSFNSSIWAGMTELVISHLFIYLSKRNLYTNGSAFLHYTANKVAIENKTAFRLQIKNLLNALPIYRVFQNDRTSSMSEYSLCNSK